MPEKVIVFGSNSRQVVAERLEKLRAYAAALQRVLVLDPAKDAMKSRNGRRVDAIMVFVGSKEVEF